MILKTDLEMEMPVDGDVIIRALDIERDIPGWTEIHSQSEVIRHTLQIPYSPDSFWKKRIESSADLARFLVAECDGRVVGGISLHWFQGRRAHAGTLGMSVHDEYQGRGIGSRLLDAILDLADNWYNLRRLELEVYVDNDPAVALYRKAGFRIEGTHRSYAYRDGEYVDAYAMARIRDEPPLERGDYEEGRT